MYDLPNHASTHQKKTDQKYGSSAVNIHNSLKFDTKLEFSTNCGDIESLALDIIPEKTHNTIESVLLYRPHNNGYFKRFENFLSKFLYLKNSKMFILQRISILTYWIIVSIKKRRTI